MFLFPSFHSVACGWYVLQGVPGKVDVTTTSWVSLSLYDVFFFDDSRPLYAGLGSTSVSGFCMLAASPQNDGSVDAVCNLDAGALERFLADELVMRFGQF